MSADFAAAARQRTRFTTPQGQLSVEDLWGLPLTSTRAQTANLNDIAKGISRTIKEAGDEDFVDNVKKPNVELAFKLDLVKHIIEVKKNERNLAEQEHERQTKIQRLREIIANKQDKELESKSTEELLAQLAALKG